MKYENPLYIRSKIWIEDETGAVVFGLGRLRILDAISRHGSIQGAAKELKMSYRAIWGRLTTTENRLNRPLLVRQVGGSSGGGSRLTPFAEKLVAQFRLLHRRILVDSDEAFEQALDSGLMSD